MKINTGKDIDSFLTSIENDPFGLDDDKEFKEKQIDQFNKTQSEIGTNMAVVMFMVDALKYFENKPINEIKEIAFEIAMQGTMGYSPDKDGYLISKIPNKSFTITLVGLLLYLKCYLKLSYHMMMNIN